MWQRPCPEKGSNENPELRNAEVGVSEMRPLVQRDKEESSVSALDRQEGGTHYKGYKIQPVEFAMANGLNLCQANIVKYTLRHSDKGGLEDLRKARHYLELLAEYEYGVSL